MIRCLYCIFATICIITVILLLWKLYYVRKIANILFIPEILEDDVKIIHYDDKGHPWTLGDVRRCPLGQKGSNISMRDLPKIDHAIQAELTSFGMVNRSINDANVVIYNRVPKTGSSTMQNLLYEKGDELNFTVTTSYDYWSRANSAKEEIEFVQFLKNVTFAMVYDKHLYFVDVTRYSSGLKVNWVNMVRDPIDRYASNYYYNRQAQRWNSSKKVPSKDWFDRDISECILNNDPECELTSNYLIEQQLTYFCGSAPECRIIGNDQALNMAKHNAEKYYSVIGITEHMRVSLAVFELYLPRFFLGFINLYGRKGQGEAKNWASS